MAIILDTSTEGAITTYSDLVTELRDLQDNEEYDEEIARAVRKAEAFFLRRLRLAEMELETTLEVTEATADLPSDCREIRAVIWQGGGREYPLNQMSLSALAIAYGGNGGACPLAYAREGTALRFGPVADGSARLVYYADLTPLAEGNPTNWLLSKAPDLYIAGAQYYLCRRERDDAGATMALQETNAIIASLQDEANRLAGGNLTPFGIHQVFGSRI